MENFYGLSPFFQGYVLVIIFIVGLIFGSFFNVVALRLLWGESIVLPPSKCPKCGYKLKWYDNIPLISYILLLKGKCRNCKEKISIQYPIVELITGLLFLGVFLIGGFSLKTLFLWILTGCLIVMTITDLKEKVIFDITSIPLIPIGLIYTFFNIAHSTLGQTIIPLPIIGMNLILNSIFIYALIGAVAGVVFFEVISGFSYLILKERAFGEGDTIIAAALGAWFGWKALIAIILISFILQLIIGIPLIIYNMNKDKDYKSLFATIILLSSVFIPLLARFSGLANTFLGAVLSTLLSFGIAIYAVVVILTRAKERQSFTFLPFGPALVLGGFMVMFYGDLILKNLPF
ncbi:MAG: prepilin peptidase [Candidatus Gastranaerophilaceae bacterium]|jgi:leader peptidase (prepilin peptidase)/N-methyltransferase